MTKVIELYDYQSEMIARIDAAFKSHRSLMVQMPTGTGKTYLLASVVFRDLEKSDAANVWIVVHRRELVEQIEDTLSKFGSRDGIRVVSIQWLSRHYVELREKPSLIVIDEAHHAVAKTYAGVMNAYPEVKILGMTATPCRLRKNGFTDLFDVLLMSWSTKRFIAAGRLSLYNYMSIKADSEEQQSVFGLTRRGADGDFSQKEMSEMLDVKPSIRRLCDTILQYAAGKKGITYAIDIAHAEHIAAEYRRNGIHAVAISSKTPSAERRTDIERFKDGKIQVLVNVDLFGEGFDCPDVEFIQLARPTLSLSKYLQQVGRGMRVFEGKKYCLILDNVGLYRLFGLPSDDRDWQDMFEGKVAGKGDIAIVGEKYDDVSSARIKSEYITPDDQTELITVMTHDGQRMDLDAAYGYEIKENEDGLFGVNDKNGNEILPCIYRKIELKSYGFAKLYSRKKIDRESPWIDLRNNMRFVKQPKVDRHGVFEFSTSDGIHLYPRVKTRQFDESCFVLADTLKYGTDNGLRFKNFFIHPSEPTKLYAFKDKIDDISLWEDEEGGLVWRKSWDTILHPITNEEWAEQKTFWKNEIKQYEKDIKLYFRQFTSLIHVEDIHGRTRLADYEEPQNLRISCTAKKSYQAFYRQHWLDKWESLGTYTKVFPQAYGIRVVQNWNGNYLVRTSLFKPFENPELEYDYAELLDDCLLYITENGTKYWVYLENNACFTVKPEFVTIGFVDFIKIGSVYMERGTRSRKTYRRTEIRAFDNVCFIGNKIIVKTEYRKHRYYIRQRHLDGRRLVLSDGMDSNANIYDMYYDGKNLPQIKRRLKNYEIKDRRK